MLALPALTKEGSGVEGRPSVHPETRRVYPEERMGAVDAPEPRESFGDGVIDRREPPNNFKLPTSGFLENQRDFTCQVGALIRGYPMNRSLCGSETHIHMP